MERRDFLTASLVGADKLGEFPFQCDVFCGTGHGQMDGTVKVTAGLRTTYEKCA